PRHLVWLAIPLVWVAGCGMDPTDSGASTSQDVRGVPACDADRAHEGQASSVIPDDSTYVITTFGTGAAGDSSGRMSCGEDTKNGSWYYAASRQRYGCGSRIRIEGNGNCVVAETDDYGPQKCLEEDAQMPILDVSPLVAM